MQGYEVTQGSTAYPLVFLLISSTDHISPITGATPTVVISKGGSAFAAPAGAVTEIGDGWYKVAGNATDTAALGPLILHATATGADPTDALFPVVAVNPQSATAFVSSVPAVAGNVAGSVGSVVGSVDGNVVGSVGSVASGVTISVGTGAGQINLSNGRVPIQASVQKDTALNGFQFYMALSSDHVSPATGKTITATRSLDGGVFAGCANAAVEIGNGWYEINLAAADLNGNTVALSFAASGCDTTLLTITTQP